MRSVIQEASSLALAIEQAWEKAGKPKDFSVKIFQESEKGFLGLRVTKKAKVGLFFENAVVKPLQSEGRQRTTGSPRSKSSYDNRSSDSRSEVKPDREVRERRPADRSSSERSEKSVEGGAPRRSNFNRRPARTNDRSASERTAEKSVDKVSEPRKNDFKNDFLEKPKVDFVQKSEHVAAQQEHKVDVKHSESKRVINAFGSKDDK